MPTLKITSWNIEDMNLFFNAQDRVRPGPEREGVARKVAAVIDEVAPDVLCVQEGPSRRSRMETFVDEFLSDTYTIVAGETGGGQKPFILIRDSAPIEDFAIIDFDADAWEYPFLRHSEQTGRYSLASQNFTRLPVEVLIETSQGTFSLMCLHLKSKFSRISNRARSSDPTVRTRAIAEGLEQRARILQEATLLRDYVQNYPFAADVQGRFILAGDLNDGPGRDFFETRFFSTDILRRIRGDVDHPDRILTNVLDNVPSEQAFSAIFFDNLDRELRRLLLDHLLVSPDLLQQTGLRVDPTTATVEQEAYENQNDGDFSRNDKPDRELYPSDHRPVSVNVEF